MSHLKSEASVVKFHVRGPDITDKVQSSGRLVPVFPSIIQDSRKHEEYIARMIARDREANFG